MAFKSQNGPMLNSILDWLEEKILSLQNERLRKIAIMFLTHLQEHPYITGFAISMAFFSLAPLSFFIGFILIANACLMSGAVIIEVLIFSAGLSVLIPVLLFSIFISMVISGILLLVKTLVFKTKKNASLKIHQEQRRKTKLKDHDAKEELNAEFWSVDELNKETQTLIDEDDMADVEELGG